MTRQIPLVPDLQLTQNNNLTLINNGTPTCTNASGKEDVNDLIFISQPTVPNFRDFWVGDNNGSDHFVINVVFSYKPIYNKMNEKTVRLFHKADWIDINFAMSIASGTMAYVTNCYTPALMLRWISSFRTVKVRILGHIQGNCDQLWCSPTKPYHPSSLPSLHV